MNSKELYVNICQIIADGSDVTWPRDFDRELKLHISRSSHRNAISHITAEYAGVRAKFFCCMTFDGSGDYGTGIQNFAMPKLKLNMKQKALIALSIIDHLISRGLLDANFEFFREKFHTELNGGVGGLLDEFELIRRNSIKYLAHREAACGESNEFAL